MEYQLLQALMERAGKVVLRHDLLDLVWGEDWVGDPHTLDVHIRWLREKIEAEPGKPRYIQTVRGVGYRFAPADEVEA
jgi:DNA-binding response OmpR family regulator